LSFTGGIDEKIMRRDENFRPLKVKALPNSKLWVKYSDGVEGEVDLSHLGGKGVFSLME
jgi:hypothetical protein